MKSKIYDKSEAASHKSSFKIIAFILVPILLLIVAVAVYFVIFSRNPVRNVLLISLDTVRSDHLSCYGFKRKTTPNIDAIAAEGILFENAITPVPLTLPAHSSMLTGTYPPYHKVHDNINFKLGESNITLPEILKQHGFISGAVISAYVLYPQFGTDQGFDYYNSQFVNPIMAGENRDTERRGDETAQFCCEFIEKNKDRPFFLFAHFYDPHTDYDPPEPFASQYPDDPYSGEIAFTDYCVQQLVEKLKKLDLYDSTLIIIVGDHGESLGEHGETEHGYFIYQSTVKIPFIIRPHGRCQPKRIKDVASLVDIVPTVLSYLKIDIPDYIQGKDLSVYQKNESPVNKKRYVYTESLIPTKYGCNPLLGLVDSQYKYIKTTRPELYDINKDSLEENNFLEEENNRARLMEGHLQELATKLVSTNAIQGKFELDEESRKRLESLGYIGGDTATDAFEFDRSKRDPKDMIGYYDKAQKVTRLKYKALFTQAETLCYEMLNEWPQMPNTHFILTQLAYSQGKLDQTIKHGTEYIDMIKDEVDLSLEATGINPSKGLAMAHKLVAQAAYDLEKLDLAINYWSKALQIKANWPDVLYSLGAAFFKKGNNDKAINYWTKALEFKPDWIEVRQNLDKLLKQKQREATVIQYLEMVKQNPDDADTHDKLAKLFYQKGEVDKAVEHFEQVVRIEPDSINAHNILAGLYHKKQNFQLAVKHWTKVIEIKPDWPEVYNNLAYLLATIEDKNVRNPKKAIKFAEHACELTEHEKPDMLDTLGVAYAADGRFSDAVKTAERAKKQAIDLGNQELVKEIQQHLDLYKQNKPYRD